MMNVKRGLLVLFALVVAALALVPVGAQQAIVPFPVGQPLLQNVNVSQLSRSYQLNGVQDKSLFLLALSQDYNNTPAIMLTDNMTNRTMAMINLDVSGMCLRIAPGTGTYTLTVTNQNAPLTQFYGLMLMQDEPDTFACQDEAMYNLAEALEGATIENTNQDGSFTTLFIADDGSLVSDTGEAVTVSSLVDLGISNLSDLNLDGGVQVGEGGILLDVDGNALLDENGFPITIDALSGAGFGGFNLGTGVAVDENGELLNLGTDLGADEDGVDIGAGADAVDDGELIDIDADVDGREGGLDVGADADVGEEEIVNAGTSAGNGSGLNVEVPPLDTDAQVGGSSGTCVNVLGVQTDC